jgi:hypothetical protein
VTIDKVSCFADQMREGMGMSVDDVLTAPAALPSERLSLPSMVASGGRAWSAAQRVGFRLLFAYWVVYLFPFPFNLSDRVAEAVETAWQAVGVWVGRWLFGLEITVFINGSGDTTYNYVQTFCYVALAVLAASVWTLLERRQRSYARLHAWLRVYLRLALATQLMSYGAAKAFSLQFPSPTLDRMLQTIGETSPMGLLWTFMGASPGYQRLTGLAELTGALLLISRRTTLLGSLVCAAVMGQVVALNFFYDVPVKLFSLHLLAMSLTLAAPDVPRLLRFFVLGKAVEPAPPVALLTRRWAHRGALVLRTTAVAGLAIYLLYASSESFTRRSSFRPPLHGIWEVESFERGGKVLPAALAAGEHWRRLVFDYPSGYPSRLAVQSVTGSLRRWPIELDEAKGQLALRPADAKVPAGTFRFTEQAGSLTLEGTFEGEPLRLTARRVEPPQFLLTSRGFHWINEYPLNR